MKIKRRVMNAEFCWTLLRFNTDAEITMSGRELSRVNGEPEIKDGFPVIYEWVRVKDGDGEFPLADVL